MLTSVRRCTSPSRFPAWVVAIAVLLAHLGGHLHRLATPHAYCEVHQTIEHVAQAGHGDHAPGHDHGSVHDRTPMSTPGHPAHPEDGEQEHDSCDLSLFLPCAETTDALDVPRALEPCEVRAAPLADEYVASGARIFSLAPKNSPPRV